MGWLDEPFDGDIPSQLPQSEPMVTLSQAADMVAAAVQAAAEGNDPREAAVQAVTDGN